MKYGKKNPVKLESYYYKTTSTISVSAKHFLISGKFKYINEGEKKLFPTLLEGKTYYSGLSFVKEITSYVDI